MLLRSGTSERRPITCMHSARKRHKMAPHLVLQWSRPCLRGFFFLEPKPYSHSSLWWRFVLHGGHIGGGGGHDLLNPRRRRSVRPLQSSLTLVFFLRRFVHSAGVRCRQRACDKMAARTTSGACAPRTNGDNGSHASGGTNVIIGGVGVHTACKGRGRVARAVQPSSAWNSLERILPH